MKIKTQKVSRHKSLNLFPSKSFIETLYVCTVCNIEPCQIQLILSCVLLKPMFANHPKILISQKLRNSLGLFGLKSFCELVFIGGKIKRIACLVCLDGTSLQKILPKRANSSRKIQKTLKFSNGNAIISQIFR